jgi:hypothetical protein
MAIAKGIYKQVAFKKQTGLGVPAVGAGGQLLRRKTFSFDTASQITTNDEIASHMQDTGVAFGQKSANGKLEANLSPLTYKMLLSGLIRQDFAATTPVTGVAITIAGSGPYTVTRGAGSWLDDGIKNGDIGRLSAGTFNAANANKNLFVISVTAAVLTVVALNKSTLVAEGPISGATFTVVGKKAFSPTSGQTNDYFTFEEWYADISHSEVFPDCKVSQCQINMPATGAATASFDIVGRGQRTIAAEQAMATPGAETTTGVVQAVSGILYVNGAEVTGATGAQLTIDSGVAAMGANIGSNVAVDLNQSRLKVSGSFTAQFSNSDLMALHNAQASISLTLVGATSLEDDSDFVAITLGKIRITGDTPDDGEKEIIRTYNFTAELNGEGGEALAYDKTIISIQDSAA